jgi:hypothetical protein
MQILLDLPNGDFVAMLKGAVAVVDANMLRRVR